MEGTKASELTHSPGSGTTMMSPAATSAVVGRGPWVGADGERRWDNERAAARVAPPTPASYSSWRECRGDGTTSWRPPASRTPPPLPPPGARAAATGRRVGGGGVAGAGGAGWERRLGEVGGVLSE